MHGHHLQPPAGLTQSGAMNLIWTQGMTNSVLNHFCAFSFNTEIVGDQKTYLIQLSLQDKPENLVLPLTNKNLSEVCQRDKVHIKALQNIKEGEK